MLGAVDLGFRLLGDIEGEDGPERVMQRARLAG
jgi:hypothetical protein